MWRGSPTATRKGYTTVMPPRQGMFSRCAIERLLGIADARGPQGIMSRGSNVYNGGMPSAQFGPGNPNIGRPNTRPTGGLPAPNESLTTMVGSLPPNPGQTLDPTMQQSMLDVMRARQGRMMGSGY